MSHNRYFQYCEMILLAIDGQMDDEQFSEFDRLLREDVSFRQYYLQFMSVNALLGAIDKLPDARVSEDGDSVLSHKLWLELAHEEKTAEAIEIETPEEMPEPVKMTHIVRTPQKINKFSFVSVVISAAAVVMIMFIHFVPPEGVQVATLTDCINARWGDASIPMKNGLRLSKGSDPMQLQQGLASVLFDSGVSVVIEAPSEFQIVAEDQIEMIYGRLYAMVPTNAIGFSVETTNSRIIDLGTEFGVYAPQNGQTELHVFKGKTSLITGTGMPGISRVSSEVLAGQAKRIHYSDSHVDKIPIKSEFFARMLDSQTGTIWRGEAFSLANVVTGGNGFSGGNIKSGIDPTSGLVYPEARQEITQFKSDSYIAVKARDFIDGVFIPNGQRGENQITSAGHLFSGFSVTDGSFYTDITSYPYVVEIQGKEADSTPKKGVISKMIPISRDPEVMDQPCIFIHANAGITFDLRQIRQSYPMLEMTSFTARCESPSKWERKAEFWVLLDGVCVFHCTADEVRGGRQKEVEVPILPAHAFLTLATTDGQDGKAYDWCLFMEPEIMLTPRISIAGVDFENNK